MQVISLIVAMCLVTAILGCAQQPNRLWLRTDGQRIQSNPVLAQALEMDGAICKGEMQKANLSGVAVHGGGLAGLAVQMERQNAAGEVFNGCMAQRGYALVDEKDAPARSEQYKANAQLALEQSKQKHPTVTGSIKAK